MSLPHMCLPQGSAPGRTARLLGRIGLRTAMLAALCLPAAGCTGNVREASGKPTVWARGSTPGGPIEYVQTTRREGVTQGFLLLHARQPVGSVILFTGGDGVLNLVRGGTLERGGNFLVRTRKDFVKAGFTTALVDTPSDQSSLRDFRTTEAHAVDIAGVIDYLRALGPGPVWLIGTSRGSVSAASVAARLSARAAQQPAGAAVPDGIVLTSSITFTMGGGQTSVYSADLDAIRMPVLILSHTHDACPVSLASGSALLAKKLRNAAAVEFKTLSGGKPPESGECDPFSPHGFFGVEQEATGTMIAWMKAHAPAAK